MMFAMAAAATGGLIMLCNNGSDPAGPSNEYKNFAPHKLNKWYKCKIAYDYSVTTNAQGGHV